MKNIHCMQKIISFLLVWSVCFQLDGSIRRLSPALPSKVASKVTHNYQNYNLSAKELFELECHFALFYAIIFTCGYYTAAKKIDPRPIDFRDGALSFCSAISFGLGCGLFRDPIRCRLPIIKTTLTIGALGLGYRYLQKN